jgi:transcriptional regulator
VTSDHHGPRLIERHTTVRAELKEILRAGAFTSRDLSARVGISEKDVAGHLEHLARSVQQSGERLDVEHARCLACGFVFKDRTRLTKPSRCPRCKGERLAPARYRIVERR